MYYFAYGSNMSSKRLKNRINAKKIANGKLLGYQLRFHKIGKDGTGKCDISEVDNMEDFVLGVIYEVSDSDIMVLDRIEGVGNGYDSITVNIELNRKDIKAACYVATNINENLKPLDWYKKHVFQGAIENNFDMGYIEMIENVSYVEDTDRARKNKELSMYE